MKGAVICLACFGMGVTPLAAQSMAQPGGPAADGGDFAGQWEASSDDGTELHLAELAFDGSEITGQVVRAHRGYFSGRVEVQEQLELVGRVRGGVLEFTGILTTSEGGTVPGATGTGFRRADYLILRLGTYEVALAPPGVPLVRPAERSAEAAAFARLIGGREYSSASEAHGRDAFVGGRVGLRLCADGRIAYSRSDLVATPGALPGTGVDGGDSWSRRGTWSVVLYAGAPTVRAEWEGTGTTYSLVQYIGIEPATDGRSAVVEGTPLPVTGQC